MTRYRPNAVAWSPTPRGLTRPCDQDRSAVPGVSAAPVLRSEPALAGLSARVPAPIAAALCHYLDLMAKSSHDLLAGFYLTGSIALGAFDARCSDVDFVALLNRPATWWDSCILQDIHMRLVRAHPGCRMNGSYVQRANLGRLPPQVAPCPYYGRGILQTSSYHDLNPVTWWLLRHQPVVLAGPHPADLAFDAEWESVTSYVQHELDHYWPAFIRTPHRLACLLTASGVQWAILRMCRNWHTLEAGEITSKLAAGEYIWTQAPQQWRPAISEAMGLRRGEPSRYASRIGRAIEVAAFLNYMVGECRTRFGAKAASVKAGKTASRLVERL